MILTPIIPVTLIISLLLTSPVYAYIGPGLGAGTIATILGVLGSIIVAIIAVLYYPIKRTLKKRKKKNTTQNRP